MGAFNLYHKRWLFDLARSYQKLGGRGPLLIYMYLYMCDVIISVPEESSPASESEDEEVSGDSHNAYTRVLSNQ